MPIVHCPACGCSMKLTDEQMLRKTRCPKCKQDFTPEVIPVAPLVRPGDPPPRKVKPPTPPLPSKPASKPHKSVEILDDVEVPDEVLVTEVESPRARRGMVTRTRVALLLMFLGQCFTLVSVLFGCLFLILSWAQAGPTEHRVEIIGVPGLIGWIASAVGVGFAVAGLRRSWAMEYAVALAAISLTHLILLAVFVLYDSSGHNTRTIRIGDDRPSPLGQFRVARAQLQFFDTALPCAFTSFGLFAHKLEGYAKIACAVMYLTESDRFGFLAALVGWIEVARWMLLGLWLKAIARVSRAHDQENPAMLLAAGVPIMVGVLFMVNLVVSLMPQATTQAGAKTLIHSLFAAQLLGFVAIIALTVLAGVVTHTLRSRVRDREPRPKKR